MAKLLSDGNLLVKYDGFAKNCEMLGGVDLLNQAIDRFTFHLKRGSICVEVFEEGRFPETIVLVDSPEASDVNLNRVGAIVEKIERDDTDPLVLNITLTPTGLRSRNLLGGFLVANHGMALVPRITTFRAASGFKIEEIVTFDAVSIAPASAVVKKQLCMTLPEMLEQQCKEKGRLGNPEKLLYEAVFGALEKLTVLRNGDEELPPWAVEMQNALRKTAIDYADAVAMASPPVRWNEIKAKAYDCLDHKAVRPAAWSEMNVDDLTLGIIKTDRGDIIVRPGEWIVERIKGRYEIYTDEEYHAVFH